MEHRKSRSVTGGYGLAASLAVAGLTLFILGAWIGFAHDAENDFGMELGKGLLTLGTGLILGGTVKVLLDRFQERAKERDEEHEALERLLSDLRLVHDRAESARLLIAAHRTAKSYGDQMRDLIGCQVVLLKVKRVLDVRRLRGVGEYSEDLEKMIGYLRALQFEYRDQYKLVSDLQRYDEAVTKLRFDRVARREVEGDNETTPPDSSRQAWGLISDDSKFPMLYDLSARGTHFREDFVLPLHRVASMILGRSSGEADANFDAAVDKEAERIRGACTATQDAEREETADQRTPA